MYETIEIENDNSMTTVWLNRPEVRNAFNGLMVHELHQAFLVLLNKPGIRLVVIRGRGPAFCSGADLHWMREIKDYTYEKNVEEGLALAKCLAEIYHFPHPVVVLAQGAVVGGGIGIASVADISITSMETSFLFSEVTIGLVPAVISPYVIKRTGLSKAKELMMLGERFTGEDAVRYGLINMVVAENDLESTLTRISSKLLKNSPSSLLKTKEMLHQIGTFSEEDAVMRFTAKILAYARRSEDGQEGMTSFLEKRPPEWK